MICIFVPLPIFDAVTFHTLDIIDAFS